AGRGARAEGPLHRGAGCSIVTVAGDISVGSMRGHVMKRSLLLALCLTATLGAAALEDDPYPMSTGQSCPLEGTAKNNDLKALNRDKGRSKDPTADDIDTDVSLAAMLAPGEDQSRFDESRAASVVGFVVNVKVG